MRSPAPVLDNGKDRAEVIRNEFPNTTSRAGGLAQWAQARRLAQANTEKRRRFVLSRRPDLGGENAKVPPG